MKALKLKSSSKEDPIWGYTYLDCGIYHKIVSVDEPTIFDDYITMHDIRESTYHSALDESYMWELVNVKITIE